MSLILEEDGEMAYCTNCGKSAVIPPGEILPDKWTTYFGEGQLGEQGEKFCSDSCELDWLMEDPEMDSFLDDFDNGRLSFG